MVEIIEADSKKLMKKFASFPLALYKDCEYYVPALYSDEVNLKDVKKNPAAKGCKVKCFLAMKEGKVAGRIAGIIIAASNEKMQRKMIRFSRFDFIDDFEVSSALMHAVEEYGRHEGMTEIHGPWDFNDTGKEGLLVSGFDTMSTFVTQYCYAYYKDHVEKLGFEKEVGWDEFFIYPQKEFSPRVDKLADYCLKRYELREVETKSASKTIKKYGTAVFDMYNEAYAGLYGTIHLEPEVVQQTLKLFGLILLPEYISIVVDKNDKPVGMGVAVPSVAEAMNKCKGKLFPFGFIRLLHALRHPKKLELALVGVLDEYRNKGVNGVLMRKIVKNAIKNNIQGADTNPELESNASVHAFWENFERVEKTKSRQTYIKNL